MSRHLLFLIGFTFSITSAWAAAPDFDKDQQKSVCTVYSRWYSKPLHTLLTGYKWPSVVMGALANTRVSALYIPHFIKKYGLNEHDFEKPVSEYTTFNEFFVRKLKASVRSVSIDQESIVSPADGAVLVIPDIGESTQFPIKGVSLSLHALLKDKKLAEEFEGGTAFVVRLAPWDYHRLHFPLAGVPSAPKIIHGRYESVHPFVYSCGIQPLQVNERHLIVYETSACGTVALIPVGALFVGAITETYTPGEHYNKGDEMAYFSFGGSTIVMLFKKDTIQVSPEIIENSAQGKETLIKMGQTIGLTSAVC